MSATFPKPPPGLRILEIGAHAEIASAFPNETQVFWTYYKTPAPDSTHPAFSIRRAWQVWREARAGKIDLVWRGAHLTRPSISGNSRLSFSRRSGL